MTSAAQIDSEPGGLFGWYRALRGVEKRTFWACFGGWALDAMNAQLFSFALPAIIATFAINNEDAGFIGTIALLSSAFGGWTTGVLCDRFGRVRMLQVSIIWFSLFTFLCGFAQSYWELLTLRALLGFGFGGEWAAGAVLIGEMIGGKDRAKAVGGVQSGWSFGWAIAALLATLIFSLLPQELAWRALFWLGVLPGLLVFFLRLYVEDPPVFKQCLARRASGEEEGRFLDIFSPPFLRTTVLAALLAAGAQGGYYAVSIWLPDYLRRERHLSVLDTGASIGVIIAGSFGGYLVGAYLADHFGRRPTFILFAIGSAVTVLLYTLVPLNQPTMVVLGLALGFFPAGVFSGMGAFLTENFPTAIRGSGQGFCYNFGRGIGALNPALVGILSGKLSLGSSIGILASAFYGLLIVAALLLPETKGKELTA